jgi:proteasome beta subunit
VQDSEGGLALVDNLPFDRLPGASLDPTSFSDVLRKARPDALPPTQEEGVPVEILHGTTILALQYEGGVVIAGDRRATEGFTIAHRSIQKIFPTDRSSAIGIAGAAGPAIEMVRLFQTQLEHYEKIAGVQLTLEGKANQLAGMLRANFPLAAQGLVVVPIFTGFDDRKNVGRIFKYDVTGGRYEESDFWATGSGGRDARATIKKRYRPGLSREDAVKIALEALFDASEEDVGTGGPDVLREIYPDIAHVSAEGFAEVPDDEIASLFDALMQERRDAGRVLPRERVVDSPESRE